MNKIISFFRKLFRKPATGGIVSMAKEPNLLVLQPSCFPVPESIAEELQKYFDGGVFEIGKLEEGDQVFKITIPDPDQEQKIVDAIKFKLVNEDPCV